MKARETENSVKARLNQSSRHRTGNYTGARGFWMAVVGLLFACALLPRAATAAPITYDLIGATETWTSYTDAITGNFTFDPTTDVLVSIDIQITGTLFNENLTVPIAPPLPGWIRGSTEGFGDIVTLVFGYELGNVPDILLLTYHSAPPLFGSSTSATGEAVPTPLPAAFPLFVTGLGVIGLFGWRRKWKAIAAACLR